MSNGAHSKHAFEVKQRADDRYMHTHEQQCPYPSGDHRTIFTHFELTDRVAIRQPSIFR